MKSAAHIVIAVAVALAPGCYEPPAMFAEGLPCSAHRECPPGQACTGGGEGRCHCDVLAETGCSDGNKCGVIDSIPVCFPPGTMQNGDLCTSSASGDDCDVGLACLFTTCHAFCDVATACDRGSCQTILGVKVCADTCYPLNQDCPMSGTVAQNCYVSSSFTPFCSATTANLSEGAGCSNLTDCTAGTGCHGGFCRRYCDYGASPDKQGSCFTSQTCQQLVSNIGICK